MADDNDNNTERPTDSRVKEMNGAEGGFTLVLRKSVTAHGDEVKELKFREPTAADIETCGNPVNITFGGDTPKMTFEARAMSSMMSALAAVPPSTIKQLHPRDWNTAAWNLASFFMPDL